VRLGDLEASLTSTCAPFMAYAAAHVVPLRIADQTTPRVQAVLRWHEGSPPRDRLAADPTLRHMERLDRDLYRGATQLAWFRIDELPNLHLRFTWDGELLHVDGDYYHRLSADPRRDWLKRVLFSRRLPALRRRRFTTLLYYLLYYPAFWWLERHQDLHPIHAAGVEIGNTVVVLAGPSGVGKSTLVTGLAATPVAQLLSDTFLLQRGTTVQRCRSRCCSTPGASAGSGPAQTCCVASITATASIVMASISPTIG